MDAKPLIFGITGFILGGLLVSVAASLQMDRQQPDSGQHQSVATLRDKTGDAFDRAFLSEMIQHHDDAVAMANLAEQRAKHGEVKQLAQTINRTQSQEIDQMQSWQEDWGYRMVPRSHGQQKSH